MLYKHLGYRKTEQDIVRRASTKEYRALRAGERAVLLIVVIVFSVLFYELLKSVVP